MSPLRSVGGRLALALLVVVAGVLAIVYLIVVPSYRASLENNELRGLAASLRSIVPDLPGRAVRSSSSSRRDAAPTVNARVVVYDLQNITPALLEPVADSNLDSDSIGRRERPGRLRRDRAAQTLARGIVTRNGQTYAEVAYPLGASVVLLLVVAARPAAGRVASSAGACSSPAALATAFARAARLRAVRASSRAGSGGSRTRPSGSPRASFDEPVVDHGSDELGQLARTFERMRLRLAHLDRARGEFIANASHELRTPLFSLGGFLELLDDPTLDEATRDEFLAPDAGAGRRA